MEGISKNYDNQKDEEIEKKIMSILSGQEKALEQLDTHVNELKQQESELSQDLQMKRVELERAEKRLESLHHAQPQHLSELTQYENELSIIYRLYVEKIRNHDYLQNRVEKYQIMEETSKKNLSLIIDKNKKLEQYNIHDQNDIIDDNMNYEQEEETDNRNQQQQFAGGNDIEGEGGNEEMDDLDDDDDHF